jgi:hypothetical protein
MKSWLSGKTWSTLPLNDRFLVKINPVTVISLVELFLIAVLCAE